MGIYTKKGDLGYTSLVNGKNVAKYDKSIELLGTIDELNSVIGLAKVLAMPQMKEQLCEIQDDLIKIMAGIAQSGNKEHVMQEVSVKKLEKWIDQMENSFQRPKKFVRYGGCELSARLDVARSVARRAERLYCYETRNYTVDRNAKSYMNRISDYLYVCARYADALKPEETLERI